MLRTVTVDLAADERLAKELVATGGVFAGGAKLKIDEQCNLVLRAGQEELRLLARAVLVTDAGAGLEIIGRTSEMREHIAAFARIASYIASTRDPQVAAARTHRQDTIPNMPPQHAPPRRAGTAEIVERVRRVNYEDSGRRLAVGSQPPDTTADDVPLEKRRSLPDVPLALAPTQQAGTLEQKAIAARLAAHKRADVPKRDPSDEHDE